MTESTQPSIRVAVRHRLPVISAGIMATLSKHPDLRLLPLTAIGEEAEVIVADFRTGLSLASVSSSRVPGSRLLVFADTDREQDVRAALSAGVTGYVLHDCAADELTSAVVALAAGSRYLCARVVERLADSLTHDSLTPRELDVLSLMVQGLNNKLIARELHISLGTVKAHANAVYGKLNASSRLHAVAVAVARGIGSLHIDVRHRPEASLDRFTRPRDALGLS